MKNLLLLLAMLITTSTVFSQLYVTPNGATDSYVYVKDEILFVEQDVNLVENTNNTATKASIYLREGSQLIQGSTVDPTGSDNKGTGYVSIYQTVSETSNYHYNFWHSPVGNQTLGSSGNQNAGVSRLYEIFDVTDSKLANTTTGHNGDNSPLTISTRWIYKRLQSATNEQEANYIHVGPADNIPTGLGFTMKGVSDGTAQTNDPYEYDFRGRPNNGDITVDVGSGNKWTLSGNPYPSSIDLKTFWTDNVGNGLNGILFWDEPKDSEWSHYYTDKSGGYGVWLPGGAGDIQGLYTAPTFATYSATGGLGGDAGTGSGALIDRRYSPVGQGFVLRTNSGGSDVTFSNSQRIFSSGTLNFRSSSDDDSTIINAVTPQIRINVVMNELYSRQLLLLFSDESTDGYDVGLDGHHPMDSGGSEAYFLIEENGNMEPFVIQTLPFDANKKIPVGFNIDGETTFFALAVEILNFDRPAYLWDTVTDTYKEINANANSELNQYILPTGEYNDRYFIVFKNGRQVIEDSKGTEAIELARASVGFFQNNPYKQMEVSNPDGYNIKTAALYDMTGKLVSTESNVGTVSHFTMSTSNLADGIYLVKLITSENINIDYKTIIKNN